MAVTLAEKELERRSAEAHRTELANHADAIRNRCASLSGFVREAWHVLEPNTTYVHGWHVDAICRHLEAITRGDITRLLINVPPGFMKSLLVSVFWPAWEWTFRPSLSYLTTAYKDQLSTRDTRKMRDLVRSDWYTALWPHVRLERTAETSFANDARGFRESMAFTNLTGGRGDRLIIDDPHSTEEVESEAERNRATRVFRESVPSRINDPNKSAIVVIMQRLHEADVSGTILSLGLPYVHLMLPMEFEPARKCVTSIDFADPRTADGELLFPERFSREWLQRERKQLTAYAYAGQYQQRPAPREGGLFKQRDFEIVDAVPANCRRCRAWDLAGSKTSAADYTAGVRVAYSPDRVFYVEDVIRFRDTPAKVEAAIRNTASADPGGTRIRLPQDPGQAGKAQAGTYVKALAGHAVRVLPVTGDKVTRATPAAAQSEAGNIKLLRGPWNQAFVDELCMFPGGAHDDQVDAFSDAVNELALSSSGAPVIVAPIIVTGSRPSPGA